jgi:hypothetical protein
LVLSKTRVMYKEYDVHYERDMHIIANLYYGSRIDVELCDGATHFVCVYVNNVFNEAKYFHL